MATNPQAIEAIARTTAEPKGSVGRAARALQVAGLNGVGPAAGGRNAYHINNWELAYLLIAVVGLGADDKAASTAANIGMLRPCFIPSNATLLNLVDNSKIHGWDSGSIYRSRIEEFISSIADWRTESNISIDIEPGRNYSANVLPGNDFVGGLAFLIDLWSIPDNKLMGRMLDYGLTIEIRQTRLTAPNVSVQYVNIPGLGNWYEDGQGRPPGDETSEICPIPNSRWICAAHIMVAARLWADTKARRGTPIIPSPATDSPPAATKNGAPVPPETPPSDDPEKLVSKPETRAQGRAVNKPDPTRARAKAQDAHRDPGRALRPPTRRHHHAAHFAAGD